MLELTTDEAKRTLDLARTVLQDIGEIDHCKYTIAYANRTVNGVRIPVIYMEFDYPEILDSGMQPALAVTLTNFATASLHDNDKLRRMIRNAVERYLTKVGRPQKALQVEYIKITDPSEDPSQR
jgi:hypothetical protein